MDHQAPPTMTRQQVLRDAAMRRLRRLTVGAAALGAAGTVAMGGAAALTYSGHAGATAQPLAAAKTGAAEAVGEGASASAAPTAAPTATPAPTNQVASPTVMVQAGNAGSGLVTSGGS